MLVKRFTTRYKGESSGSVVEFLTRYRGAVGSSLAWVTALCPWARHINPSLVLVQPRKTCPYITERFLMGRKESKQTKLLGITSGLDRTQNMYEGQSSSWPQLEKTNTMLLRFAMRARELLICPCTKSQEE